MPNSWNTGGISDSKRSGLPNSSFSLKNCNIHDDVGILKCHKGLEDDVASGDTPTEEIVAITPVDSFGYVFGTSHVWQRTSSGVYSDKHTINPTQGDAVIIDAKFFDDFIFYSMSESLGKCAAVKTYGGSDFGASSGVILPKDNFNTLRFNNAVLHPMIVAENDLYIGNNNIISKVSINITDGTGTISGSGDTISGSGTDFTTELEVGDIIIINEGTEDEQKVQVVSSSSNTSMKVTPTFFPQPSGDTFKIKQASFEDKLTIPRDYTIESFGRSGRYLIIGTRQYNRDTFTGFSKIFKWDLVSNTFTGEQEIKEFGISAFIEHGGSLIFNAGKNGMLYSWDGNFAQEFKRIPNSIENDTVITKNAWSALNGITLLGVTQTAGAGGIYSLGGYDAKYPDVFNLPFSVTTPTVNVIEWAGSDLIFSYLISTTKKLQKLSTTLATAETESLILSTRDKKGQPTNVRPIVEYEIYPTNTTIQLYASVNRAAYSEITLNKAGKNVLSSREILDVREIQYKLVLTPDSSTKLLNPIVENYG